MHDHSSSRFRLLKRSQDFIWALMVIAGDGIICLKATTVELRELIIQKQWYSFMLWGRLSYDPDLPDPVYYRHLPQHFPRVDTAELMRGWSAASMIFPWITRFVWGDIDLKWFPEANLSHPAHKGFYTVKDYVEREPMQGSHIENILNWAAREVRKPGSSDSYFRHLMLPTRLRS